MGSVRNRKEQRMDRWKKRIITEKNFEKECAEWMVQCLEALTSHMQYGHALIAYRKQDGSFRLAKATLLPYEADFRKKYDPNLIKSDLIYWDVEQQGWRNFLIENFLEWRPIV